MAVVTEEPILSRLDRLDNMLRQLEEIRSCNKTPKSSCASTPSSGTLTSDGHSSSVDFSPKSLEKHCRPIDDVVVETGVKGTLVERLDHVEDRVWKLCLQLGEELEAEKKRGEKIDKKTCKKGMKQFVKRIIKSKYKDTAKTNNSR
ncbi:Nucleolar and coiled-body phosphoprotein like [Melia azedarach]|uniref:Nucleolar and coiled-body phosphoprotein like n=1 Tax=Melia azedarach TaxID=155640 RepID=A0ACC1XJI3_MELAZ|nr:Nucleolar and coiled-body phosphoprotein like [Melia azedarach]